MKMATSSFIYKLALLLSALIYFCTSQAPVRHPHLHLHLHPHLHGAKAGDSLQQSLELKYALRIPNLTQYLTQGADLGIGESVTLDTWRSLIKNLLQGRPYQEALQGKPNQEAVQGKPNQEALQGKPNQGAVQGKPNQEAVQGKPNQEALQGKPNQGAVQGKPNQEAVQGNPNQVYNLPLIPPPSIGFSNNRPLPSISINEKINSKQVNVGKSNAEYTDLHVGEAVVEEVGLELLKRLRTSGFRAQPTPQHPNLYIGESLAHQIGRELLRYFYITTPKPETPVTPSGINQTTQMGLWKKLTQLMNSNSTTGVTPSISTENVPQTTSIPLLVSSSSTSTQASTPVSRNPTKPSEGTTVTKTLPQTSSTRVSPPGESTIPLTTLKPQQSERQTTASERNLSSTAIATAEILTQTTGTKVPATTVVEPTTKSVATQTTVTRKLTTSQSTQAQQVTNGSVTSQTSTQTIVNKQKNVSTIASSAITGTTVIIPAVHMNVTKIPNITIQTPGDTTVVNPTSTTILSGATKIFGSTGINITLKESPGSSTATLLQNSSTKQTTTMMLSSPSWKTTESYNTTKSATALYGSVTTKGLFNGTTVPVTNLTNLPSKNSTAGSVVTTKSPYSSQTTASTSNTTGTLPSQLMGNSTSSGNSTSALSTSKPFSPTAASGSPLMNSTQGNVQSTSSLMVTYNNLTSARILAVTTAIPLMLGNTTNNPTTKKSK